MSELRDAISAAADAAESSTFEPIAGVEPVAAPAPAPAPVPSPEPTPAPVPEGEKAPEKAPPEPSKAPEGATPTPTPTPAPEGAKAPVEAPDEPPATGAHRVDRPPQSWRKEVKASWNELPVQVRQEIHRREIEANKALAEAAPAKQLAQDFQQVVGPFMARIQAHNIPPLRAVQELLKADYLLATAPTGQKAQMMAQLIKQYGVDIKELDSALVGAAPADPAVAIEQKILRQVQQMVAPIVQQQHQGRERINTEVAQTVEQMALDPAFPYFDQVRSLMADLIDIQAKRGVYLSLEEAYSKAVQLDPTTSTEIAQQAARTTASAQHNQALKAKVAASSVSGAPAGGGTQGQVGDGSLRGAIEAAFSGARI